MTSGEPIPSAELLSKPTLKLKSSVNVSNSKQTKLRRAPVRPPGPARAKSVAASAPKPPLDHGGLAPDTRRLSRENVSPTPRTRTTGNSAVGAAAKHDHLDRKTSNATVCDAKDLPHALVAPSNTPERLRPDLARVGDIRGEVRLNKRMAELGLCSRREADAWIARGWVRVNAEPAQMGQPVKPDAHIEVLPQAQHQQAGQVTMLLHKPVGYVSGQPEDGHAAAATLIGAPSQWRGQVTAPADARRFSSAHTRALAPAGRLDIDSTGLLVLTQDGRVARALIGEHSGIEKEYLVRVQWAPHGSLGSGLIVQNVQAVFPAAQLARLRSGLSLDDKPLKPAQVEWMNSEQLRFVLVEGRKRQIRRMCEQVGLHVVGLKRIRVGRVVLGNLPVGMWRYLRADERF